jgi:hypothetical protein
MTAYIQSGDTFDLTLRHDERTGIFDESVAIYDKQGRELAVFIGQTEVTLSTRDCRVPSHAVNEQAFRPVWRSLFAALGRAWAWLLA